MVFQESYQEVDESPKAMATSNSNHVFWGISGEANRRSQSPNSNDWLRLDFPQATTLSRIRIVFRGDNGVRLPRLYSVEYGNGTTWQPVEELKRAPAQPTLGISNEITINPVQTDKLRLTIVHDLPGKTGITELLAWESQ